MCARDLETRRLAPATVALKLVVITGWYRYCVEEQLIEHSPAVHVRRPKVSPESTRLDRHAAGRIVRRLAKRSGIDTRISPHSLRHAAATAHAERLIATPRTSSRRTSPAPPPPAERTTTAAASALQPWFWARRSGEPVTHDASPGAFSSVSRAQPTVAMIAEIAFRLRASMAVRVVGLGCALVGRRSWRDVEMAGSAPSLV